MSGTHEAWPVHLFKGAGAGTLLGLVLVGSSSAAPLAPPIRAMIETAFRGNDGATIAAVLDIARKTAPESLDDIQALEAGFKNRAALARSEKQRAARERLAEAGPLSLWKGELEFGGSQSRGSTDATALYGSAKLTREGLNWTQKFSARADYTDTARTRTAERIVAAYQPQLKFSQGSYGYGLTEFEHDRFLGYRDRFTVGVGLGLTALDEPGLKVVVDAGPAVRYARYYGRATEEQVAARAAVSARWALRPDLTISENAAVYVDRLHTTTRSTLTVGAKLLDPLEARVSYDFHFERDGPTERHRSDSVTRASLAYRF